MKAFIDTGMAISLISTEVYNKLRLKKELRRSDLIINQANGGEIYQYGMATVEEKWTYPQKNELMFTWLSCGDARCCLGE